jgi:GT2 family glycosyltransferase
MAEPDSFDIGCGQAVPPDTIPTRAPRGSGKPARMLAEAPVLIKTPTASIVIPNWNGAHLLTACLDALGTQTYPDFEVLVVDGASVDGSAELVKRNFPEVRFLPLVANFGFTGNVNAGLRAARGEVLALLNNDAEAEPDWLRNLVAELQVGPRTGAVASKMLHFGRRGTIASAGDRLCRNGLASQRGNGDPDDGRYDEATEVFAASGGAAAYSRAMLDDVGLLDERFVSYLEDVDLGLRAHLRGWTCRYAPLARVYHRVSATGGGRLASFYVARNSIRLLVRGFPSRVLLDLWPAIIAAQLQRAAEAARAWRGEAARATLRGLRAGLSDIPDALTSRRPIQRRRTLSDEALLALLDP